jgi:hypothetical protein
VPEISRFLGIVIAMFYREHGPPHFHAFYGGYRVTVEIESGTVVGTFPRRALAHVQEWRELHITESRSSKSLRTGSALTELLEDWQLASERKPIKRIAPLE